MHEDHRQRMRDRYLQNGFQGFSDHEMLELVLFYAIPRTNTNDIAHALLERFGSLTRVFEANVDELKQVPKVGAHSAILLKTLFELMRRCARETDNLSKRFDRVSLIAQYFCRSFLGFDHECLYAMFLDNGMTMIDCCLISEGTVNSSSVNVRGIVEKALAKKASSIVLAHNHPHGVAIPSSADLEFTDTLNNFLAPLSVKLLEHLIIVGDRFCPIMKQHCGTFRCSPLSGQIDSGFYDYFYDVDAETWMAPPIFKE